MHLCFLQVLLASLGCDLQHEGEAAVMRVRTSNSEALILDWKRVHCPLLVRDEVLPLVEEFKCLGVLLKNEGKRERETKTWISAASAVMQMLYCSV